MAMEGGSVTGSGGDRLEVGCGVISVVRRTRRCPQLLDLAAFAWWDAAGWVLQHRLSPANRLA